MDIIAELSSNPAPRYKEGGETLYFNDTAYAYAPNIRRVWDLESYVRAAALAGATHCKIQVYRASHFPEFAQTEKRRTEFPRERLGEFARLAHAYGLAAGASVFDAEAVELCARELDFLKLAAREAGNLELAGMVADTNLPYYRSISNIGHWRDFLLVKRDGYWQGERDVSHCVTLWAIQKYPAGIVDSLLQLVLWKKFVGAFPHKQWGWSSHTRGDLDCVLAARLGASVVEKHFALTANDPEVGHSLNQKEFSSMVKAIRRKKS